MSGCCPPFKPSKIVTGGTQCQCSSTFPSITIPVATLPVTVKIPVVLSELQITIPVNSIIKLPEPALEVKFIKHKVKVTQCLLLQDPNGTGAITGPAMLSIKGFVRKNIDYSTRLCSNHEGVCGDLRHCTVDVPFSCMTSVTFTTPPATLLTNTTQEFEFFRTEQLSGPGFAEKDHLLSGDFSEYNQVSQEFFNELPYCELISARVLDYTEYLNRQRPCGMNLPFEEKFFKEVEEKMTITVILKILQKQQVPIA
ncbi:CsxC family protein [Desulfotomaculum sp. 1211_IL3151]|uniref:CsxC family protein n=1 Tax=Desulfotomaculum sp. 1211_IL3151 TaxID=3084055 RepID=UPI002FDA3C69